MSWFASVIRLLKELQASAKQVVKLLTDILMVLRLRKPGLVFLKLVSNEGNMAKFVLVLPKKSAKDVVTREIVLKSGSGESQTENVLALTAEQEDALEADGKFQESGEFSGSIGDLVEGTLVEIDGASNRFSARTFQGELIDNLAPPIAGAVGFRLTSDE